MSPSSPSSTLHSVCSLQGAETDVADWVHIALALPCNAKDCAHHPLCTHDAVEAMLWPQGQSSASLPGNPGIAAKPLPSCLTQEPPEAEAWWTEAEAWWTEPCLSEEWVLEWCGVLSACCLQCAGAQLRASGHFPCIPLHLARICTGGQDLTIRLQSGSDSSSECSQDLVIRIWREKVRTWQSEWSQNWQ